MSDNDYGNGAGDESFDFNLSGSVGDGARGGRSGDRERGGRSGDREHRGDRDRRGDDARRPSGNLDEPETTRIRPTSPSEETMVLPPIEVEEPQQTQGRIGEATEVLLPSFENTETPSWIENEGYVTYTPKEQMLLSVQTKDYRITSSYLGYMQSKPMVDLTSVMAKMGQGDEPKSKVPTVILTGAVVLVVGALAVGAYTVFGGNNGTEDAPEATVTTTTQPTEGQTGNALAPGTGEQTTDQPSEEATPTEDATPTEEATPSVSATPPAKKDGRSLLPDKITGSKDVNGVLTSTFDTGSINYVQPKTSPNGQVEGNPNATPPEGGFTGNTGGGKQHVDLGYMSKYSIDQNQNTWKAAMAGVDTLMRDDNLEQVLGGDINADFYDNARTFSSGYTVYPLGNGIWMVMGNGTPYAMLQCGAPSDVKARFDKQFGEMLQQSYGGCDGYSFDVMPDKVSGSKDANMSPEDWYYTDPR